MSNNDIELSDSSTGTLRWSLRCPTKRGTVTIYIYEETPGRFRVHVQAESLEWSDGVTRSYYWEDPASVPLSELEAEKRTAIALVDERFGLTIYRDKLNEKWLLESETKP